MQVTASGSTWLDLLGPLVLKGLQVLQGLQGTCRSMIWLHELWLTSKVWPMTFTELHLNYTRCPHMRINSFSNSGENNFASFTHSGTGRGYDGTPGPPGPPGSPGFPGSPGSISVNDIINLLQRKFHLRMFGITHTYTLTYNFCLIICVMSVSFEVCCLDSSIAFETICQSVWMICVQERMWGDMFLVLPVHQDLLELQTMAATESTPRRWQIVSSASWMVSLIERQVNY